MSKTLNKIRPKYLAGNSCYYSVQTLLSSRFLSKNLKIKIYKTIISPVVLYGCEACSITLREECRLTEFENRYLRRIFGLKRGENGEWRRLQNEEFHSWYRSPNIMTVIKSIRLRWTGHVARMEEGRSVLKIVTSTPAGKRPLGRSRHKREDNI